MEVGQVTGRNTPTKRVAITKVGDATDEELVEAALRAAHEAPHRIFGTRVRRLEEDAVSVEIYVD